jgi:hypothetical protein
LTLPALGLQTNYSAAIIVLADGAIDDRLT